MEPSIRAAIRSQWAVAVLLFGAGTALAAPPQITDLMASQRPGAKLVDIAYTLTSATPVCVVSAQVSTNNGVSYDVPASNFNGSGYGTGVTPGATGDKWKGIFFMNGLYEGSVTANAATDPELCHANNQTEVSLSR